MNEDLSISAFFDSLADSWEDGYTDEELKRAAALIKRCGLDSCEILLEPGCGSGVITALLKPIISEGTILSVDISDKMTKKAVERIKAENISIVHGDLFNLPIPDESFTAVLCFNCFPHFNPQKALKTFRRVLQKGGRLFILHSIGRDALNRLHETAAGPVKEDRLSAPEVLRDMLEDAGFGKITIDDGDEYFYLQSCKSC